MEKAPFGDLSSGTCGEQGWGEMEDPGSAVVCFICGSPGGAILALIDPHDCTNYSGGNPAPGATQDWESAKMALSWYLGCKFQFCPNSDLVTLIPTFPSVHWPGNPLLCFCSPREPPFTLPHPTGEHLRGLYLKDFFSCRFLFVRRVLRGLGRKTVSLSCLGVTYLVYMRPQIGRVRDKSLSVPVAFCRYVHLQGL